MDTSRHIFVVLIVLTLAAFTTSQIGSQPYESSTEVALVLDDGSHFAVYGVSYLDGTAKQFIWLNRFSPDPSIFPFTLDEIWVLFDQGDGSNNIQVGDAIDLVVYQDADGDPSSGAALLAAISTTVQTVDGNNWSIYPLSPQVYVSGPGDVLIGVVNRYTVDGVSDTTYPAACDMTIDQGRSWWGWWQAGVPNPANLPPDDAFQLKVGNCMIRGYGETTAVAPSETATQTSTATKSNSPVPDATPTKTPIPTLPSGYEAGDVYLPLAIKVFPPSPTPLPTQQLAVVNVDNDTGGQLCYEVLNTGIGEKCFSGGVHHYGNFAPGTRSWKASARCGSANGSRYFSSGEWTHHFWCAANTEMEFMFESQ